MRWQELARSLHRNHRLRCRSMSLDCLHEFEAQADLITLGKRGETAEFASRHLGANLERIIRASYKPCLVTSRQFKPIERLLLAYDGSPSCKKMFNFLVDSSAFKGLELYIVFEAVCCPIEGNPEVAIAQCTAENNIDLLMMGAYGHNRIRHLAIGSTTTQILRSSHIPVLLFR